MDPTTETPYRRLPGRTPWFRFGAINAPATTLWLGSDHLLKIERTASRETYKRFFYRDIQAIFVEESSRRYYLAIFAIPVIGLIYLLALNMSRSVMSGLPIASLLALPFIVGLIVNLSLGATSQAVLVTAVGTESLLSLSRLRRSVQAVELLGAEVAKVQGALPNERLVAAWPAPIATAPVD